MMTGTWGYDRAAVRSTSMPSAPGIRRSVITTSTSASRSIASRPLAAWTTSCPSRRSSATRTRRRFCSSSATRILACCTRLPYTICGEWLGCVAWGFAIARGRGRKRRDLAEILADLLDGLRREPAGLGDVLDLVRRHRLRGRQEHRERRALTDRRAHFDRAAVLVDDPVADRE